MVESNDPIPLKPSWLLHGENIILLQKNRTLTSTLTSTRHSQILLYQDITCDFMYLRYYHLPRQRALYLSVLTEGNSGQNLQQTSHIQRTIIALPDLVSLQTAGVISFHEASHTRIKKANRFNNRLRTGLSEKEVIRPRP